MQTTIETILKHPSARLRQLLRLKIASVTTPVSVVRSKFSAGFNETFRLGLMVTSADKQIDGAQWVGRRATFSIDEEATIPSVPGLVEPTVVPALIVHGVVTRWKRVKVTPDEATYKLRIEPRIALYDRVHDSGVFRDNSVKDLITELFVDRRNIHPFDVEFALEEAREKFGQTVMYEESILNFIGRHCRRAGIFWYFKHAGKEDRTKRDTVVFGDNPRAYVRSLKVPYMPYSGLSSDWSKAVLSIEAVRELVPASIQLWERNYRTPHDPLEVEADVARDDRSVYGSINRSTEHHRDTDVGKMLVNARRDEQIARQTTFRGTSDIPGLMPGTVVQFTNHELPEAPYGIVITKVVTKASRMEPAFNEFEATPAHLTWRPEFLPSKHWRWVTGTIPAVIESNGKSPYAPVDAHGRYPVRPQFLRKSSTHGTDLLALRLMKPSASYHGGFHSPLLPGTEVRLQCTHGDVDRMYIAGALNDFSSPDHIHGRSGWDSRAVWRSPLLGADIRLEDRKSQEGGKFATVYMKSSVSLGYLVDSRKHKRGEGLEAWTLGHAVVRGVRGVLVSADKQDNPDVTHLEMRATLEQLESSLGEMAALRGEAQRARAEAAQVKAHLALVENALRDLQKAVILLSAPEGIGAVTRKSILHAAGEHIAATAGNNVDLSAGDSLTAAAGSGISLFAQKNGLQAFAANGKVDIQAQSGELQMFAEQDMKVTSADGNLTVSAGKSITIHDGAGAYIKLQGGNIELGCPGNITSRAAGFPRQPPSSLQEHFQSTKRLDDLHVGYVDADGQPIHTEVLNLIQGNSGALKLTTGSDGRASLVQTVFDHFKAQMPQRLEGTSGD
jgi:type VI secretion system secreted protein VgrG